MKKLLGLNLLLLCSLSSYSMHLSPAFARVPNKDEVMSAPTREVGDKVDKHELTADRWKNSYYSPKAERSKGKKSPDLNKKIRNLRALRETAKKRGETARVNGLNARLKKLGAK